MLVVSIIGPTIAEIETQVEKGKKADYIEFRFDLFQNIASTDLTSICQQIRGKILFTFKKVSDIPKYLSLGPDMVDLDASLFDPFARLIQQALPKTKLIVSKHYRSIKEIDMSVLTEQRADWIKIAAQCNDPLDWFRMRAYMDPKVTLVSMGKDGQILRILGEKFRVPLTYASSFLGKEAAMGQLSIDALTDLYDVKSQTEKTQIFGLIGDPVEQSVGHIFHNAFFRTHFNDAVYVKQRLLDENLELFFHEVAPIFSGMSVTMPLKQKVLPFLNSVTTASKETHVVNTIAKFEGGWIGTNTDGLGAMQVIQRRRGIKDQKLVIFGTGATARSIAYEASKQGAEIIIVGRDDNKAKKLGFEVCPMHSIETLFQQDILFIQTTSLWMSQEQLPFDFTKLSKKSLIFDVAVQFSPLLQWAKQEQREWISGKEMFIAQAIEQLKFWNTYEGFRTKKLIKGESIPA